jgi:putative transcriptional regulator
MAREIIVTLDVMLARRKMKAKDLAAAIGITEANLSLLKSGKVKGVRFETLAKLCEALDCKPGDLLDFGAPGALNTPSRQDDEGNLV